MHVPHPVSVTTVVLPGPENTVAQDVGTQIEITISSNPPIKRLFSRTFVQKRYHWLRSSSQQRSRYHIISLLCQRNPH